MKVRLFSFIIILFVLFLPYKNTDAQHKYEEIFMIREGVNTLMKVSDLFTHCAPINLAGRLPVFHLNNI